MFCRISQTEKEGSADIQKLWAASPVSGQNGYFARVFYPIEKLGQGILYIELGRFCSCPEYKVGWYFNIRQDCWLVLSNVRLSVHKKHCLWWLVILSDWHSEVGWGDLGPDTAGRQTQSVRGGRRGERGGRATPAGRSPRQPPAGFCQRGPRQTGLLGSQKLRKHWPGRLRPC